MGQGYIATRRETVVSVFERARARGELAPEADVDLLWQLASATIFFREFVSGEKVDDELVRRLVDNVILPLTRG
ncbi:TetR-like C-terminal domain-containing protein [Nonomuraea sp. NPDC050790]|uniref:TetR-like C-terminal domain-containing protein n=1 Tax=Nonomuraea sp. NPDC050790 TaxID=3364371 RepID=UPI0037B98933